MYSIKQISEMTGLTKHTIRFYTDCGLLPCNRGSENHRIFDDESLNWLKGIQYLKGCDMSLKAIKE